MGNRGVVAFVREDQEFDPEKTVGVYMHWNGGRDSIDAFLLATKEAMKGRVDPAFAPARFVQCVTTWMPGNSSVGLATCNELDCDNGDNGTYLVDPASLEIHGRRHYDHEEQAGYDIREIADQIAARLPKELPLGTMSAPAP